MELSGITAVLVAVALVSVSSSASAGTWYTSRLPCWVKIYIGPVYISFDTDTSYNSSGRPTKQRGQNLLQFLREGTASIYREYHAVEFGVLFYGSPSDVSELQVLATCVGCGLCVVYSELLNL